MTQQSLARSDPNRMDPIGPLHHYTQIDRTQLPYSYPYYLYFHEDQIFICALCRERSKSPGLPPSIHGKEYTDVNACGHIFHTGCLTSWLLNEDYGKCPIASCRKKPSTFHLTADAEENAFVTSVEEHLRAIGELFDGWSPRYIQRIKGNLHEPYRSAIVSLVQDPGVTRFFPSPYHVPHTLEQSPSHLKPLHRPQPPQSEDLPNEKVRFRKAADLGLPGGYTDYRSKKEIEEGVECRYGGKKVGNPRANHMTYTSKNTGGNTNRRVNGVGNMNGVSDMNGISNSAPSAGTSGTDHRPPVRATNGDAGERDFTEAETSIAPLRQTLADVL